MLGVGCGRRLLRVRCFMGIIVCGCYGQSLPFAVVVCLDGGGKEKRNTLHCQTNVVCYP